MQRRTPLKSVAYAWNRSYDARIYIKIIKHLKICSYIFLIVFLFLMYLPPAKFCNVMTSFFSFDSTWFIECVLFAATMKKYKQMIKTKTLNLNSKKVAVRNQNKKMSFDMGVTFLLSQDSELGYKDLNNLVEESKAKNTMKYTTPFKWVIIVSKIINTGGP